MSRSITVNDHMQQNYIYQLTESEGRNFASNFQPELTPSQMLALGVFGGVYMRDCRDEFPAAWFREARLADTHRDARINYFGVLAGQSLAEWRKKGWIYREDPRGWFQWYCRYYRGRRCLDDQRQISRWIAMKRHIAQITRSCQAGDELCRRRQRQAVLQWAYNSRIL